ncbi:MAG: hypothetical protein Phog2KO_32380 [Phototrophicaceae bacterium]
MAYAVPDNLVDLTKELISLRKKPTTAERFKSYPAMLQKFNDLLTACEDEAILRQVLKLDSGYFLLAGYRQRVIEKLLMFNRTPAMIRTYAMQLELFGDVDEYGEANLDIDEHVEELYAEADKMDAL